MMQIAFKLMNRRLVAAALLFWGAAGCGCQGPALPSSSPAPLASGNSGALDRAFTVLDGPDTQERLEHFRTPQKGERLEILDQVLSRLFPDGLQWPGEPEILRVLSYVAQTTRLESSGRHLGSEVLAEGRAYCYGMARAFEALCRRMGLPARINAVHNFEWMQAHNMVEVYYDESWHLFDPTYGAFFYTRPEYDGMGTAASARALLSGRVAPEYAFQTCEALWTGKYDPAWKVRPFPKDLKYGQYRFTVSELYERVLTTSFPFVQSELEMESFPMNIDMGDGDSLAVGAVDGNTEDVYGRQADGQYPRYHGAPFLGHMRLGPAFHTIAFKASQPGRFRMTYHFLPQSRYDAIGTVELRDIIMDAHEAGANAWSVVFRLQSEEGLFLVVNREHAAYVDAITVTRLE